MCERGFFHDGTWSSFRGRHHGFPIDLRAMPTWRLVVCSQNHDQIGNRARGDRLTEALDDDQLACAALLTLCGPFTPMLFMGEEWAASTPFQFFTSHPEPELGTATAEGRIAEFERMGWDPAVVPDPQDPETFAPLEARLVRGDRRAGTPDCSTSTAGWPGCAGNGRSSPTPPSASVACAADEADAGLHDAPR